MNCLKNSRSFLSRLLRHRTHVAAPPTPPQSSASRYHYYASCVLRNKRAFSRPVPPPAPPQLPRPRHYYTSPRRQEVVHFNCRRGGSQRKLTVAVLITSGGAVAFYFSHLETVPYTNRSHLVVLSPSLERHLGEILFVKLKEEFGPKILPPLHPDSIRVRLIASEIVSAVHRGFSGRQRHAASNGEDASYGYGGIAEGLTIRNRDADTTAAMLGASPDKDGLNWEVIVVKDDIVNAFCLPGGKIVVFTGLLDKFSADAEVATVLGHEVGHVIARHAAEGITKFLWMIILQIIILQFNYLRARLDKDGVNTPFSCFCLPFRRRMEIEADHIGLLLLAAAGYDPRVAPSVYEKLAKIEGDSDISTHPSSKKRAQLLSRASVMNEALELYRCRPRH